MPTILTATEINRLAQRLSQTRLGRSASVANAADRFQRLLAAKISPARAARAFASIMTAATVDQADARLTLVLDYGNPDTAGEPTTAAQPTPVAEPAPAITGAPIVEAIEAAPKIACVPVAAPTAEPNPERRRRNTYLEAKARQGELPPPPDFSAATHARFRGKLKGLVSLAERGDAEALRAVPINPVSSSPKALARYRDLCITAIEARKKP